MVGGALSYENEWLGMAFMMMCEVSLRYFLGFPEEYCNKNETAMGDES